MPLINSVPALINAIKDGLSPEYIYFWGHRHKNKYIDKSCLSQWFKCNFSENGIQYTSAEQYMMAKKAEVFGDTEIHNTILKSHCPNEIKSLGRKVQNFDENIWCNKRFDIVIQANLLKFGQNEALLNYLLSTKDKILVEASPLDIIWGIGMAADHPEINNPNAWNGLNLLGFALMQARKQLKA